MIASCCCLVRREKTVFDIISGSSMNQ